ncbi:MAG: class I adenylate-forming enzyme family protein [Planctomycetota bacterium]|jgi:O-succinylbenzoic acid--CoA ligase
MSALLIPQPWHDEYSAVPWPFLLPGVGAAQAWLDQCGLQPGMRLGLCLSNRPALAQLLQAAPLRAITVVLINHRLPVDQAQALADHARVDVLLTSETDLPDCFSGDTPARATTADPDSIAAVLFTSGSSGRAKAARLSRRALFAAAATSAQHLNLSPADRWLACLPLDHIGGAMCVWRSANSGNALELHPAFSCAAVNAAIDAGASGVGLVPTMLHRLCQQRQQPWPSTLHCILAGGAHLSAELARRCAALGRAPCRSYGMTESGAMCVGQDAGGAHGSDCGRPLPGYAVQIIADDGHTLPAHSNGLIALRGPGLFSGYDDGPTRHINDWFVTGDLGHLDHAGRLHLCGRRHDLILSGGENVYPAEVAAHLEQHPAVSAAWVCGLDDTDWGQQVAALLVGQAPDTDEWLAWLRQHLAPHQRPKRWRWLTSLPLNDRGKIDRARARNLLTEGEH